MFEFQENACRKSGFCSRTEHNYILTFHLSKMQNCKRAFLLDQFGMLSKSHAI